MPDETLPSERIADDDLDLILNNRVLPTHTNWSRPEMVRVRGYMRIERYSDEIPEQER